MARPIESPGYTAAIVLACALVQILVHMIFFLHMTPKAEGGWLLLSTAFTIVLVVITLAGSLWIVFHLNRNMMPTMDDRCRGSIDPRWSEVRRSPSVGRSCRPPAPALQAVPDRWRKRRVGAAPARRSRPRRHATAAPASPSLPPGRA